jgi:hypothetical protein
MFGIGHKARAPKKTAKKSEWKQFIQYFIFDSDNKGQLKKIISLRKEYGLPTLEQENKLSKLEIKHEEKFGILDIKRHEKLISLETTWADKTKDDILHTKIERLLDRIEKNYAVKKHKNNSECWLVPIHAMEYSKMIFPEKEKFEILKVRAFIDQNATYHNSEKYRYDVKTNNIKETIYQDDCNTKFSLRQRCNNKFSLRQRYFVFDTKEKAMFFRQEYLSLVLPYLKEYGADYTDVLEKRVDIDFERVLKKKPELLV